MKILQRVFFATGVLLTIVILIFPPHYWKVYITSGNWNGNGAWIENDNYQLTIPSGNRTWWSPPAAPQPERVNTPIFNSKYSFEIPTDQARNMLWDNESTRMLSWSEYVSTGKMSRELFAVFIITLALIIIFRPRGSTLADFYRGIGRSLRKQAADDERATTQHLLSP